MVTARTLGTTIAGVAMIVSSQPGSKLAVTQQDVNQKEIDAVRLAQQNLFDILQDKNAQKLTQHYLPEVTRFHQEGKLDFGWFPSKAQAFQSMFDNGLTLVLDDVEIADIRVYGNAAITAGYATAGWQDSNQQGETGKIRFSYVWIKTDDGWREAHHHASDFKGELRF